MNGPGAAERNATERDAEARKHFLEQVTRALVAAPLHEESVLTSLTRACVPFLADYCSVDVLDGRGEIHRVETAHASARTEAIVRALWERYPYRASDERGAPAVLRTGKPEFVPRFSAAEVKQFARDEEHLKLIREIAPRSYICVPLSTRDHVFGALSLVTTDAKHGGSGRRYTRDDLATAEEVAQRASVAVDNARHFEVAVAARREAERAVDRMAKLQQATAAFARATTVAETAQAAIGEGRAALGGGAASLGLLARSGTEVELVASVGYPEDAIAGWRRFPLASPVPMAEAIRMREIVVVTSAEQRAARFAGRPPDEIVRRFPAAVVAPLIVGSRILGALAVSYAAAPAITDDELAAIRTLAALCAQAVERTPSSARSSTMPNSERTRAPPFSPMRARCSAPHSTTRRRSAPSRGRSSPSWPTGVRWTFWKRMGACASSRWRTWTRRRSSGRAICAASRRPT